jgi:superfamily II DNA/RNA helicase
LPLCSEYIDCDTKRSDRNTILEKFKSGEIPFLINVRILVEGFNAPITKGVCFLHMPSSKTAIIQIIGRALRLHDYKTSANIILPFSNTEDEKDINNFLKILANNDYRIKQSYDRKKLGGYISLNKIESDCSEELDNNDNCEFRFTMIYDNIGKLINSEEIWMQKLEDLKAYIDEFGHRPNTRSKNIDIKKIAYGEHNQMSYYKKNKCIMKNKNIIKIWEEFINYYKQYFLSIEEKWKLKLDQLILYINKNNKLPSGTSKNKEEYNLGRWRWSQVKNYKLKKYIMKNEIIYNKWKKFIEDYKKYFLSNEEIWINNLEQFKFFIDINKRKPSYSSKNIDEQKLGYWLTNQITRQNVYTKNTYKINELWVSFINTPINPL